KARRIGKSGRDETLASVVMLEPWTSVEIASSTSGCIAHIGPLHLALRNAATLASSRLQQDQDHRRSRDWVQSGGVAPQHGAALSRILEDPKVSCARWLFATCPGCKIASAAPACRGWLPAVADQPRSGGTNASCSASRGPVWVGSEMIGRGPGEGG